MVDIRGLARRLSRKRPPEVLYAPKRFLSLIRQANEDGGASAQTPPNRYQFSQSAVDVLVHIPPNEVTKISDSVAKLDYEWLAKYYLYVDAGGIIRATPAGDPGGAAD